LKRISKLGIFLVLVGPFVFGDTPPPLPFHEYIVVGSLTRQGGGNKQHFVMSLVGRFSSPIPDTTYELIPPNNYADDSHSPWGVTDTAGKFVIDVKSHDKADSLAIRVSTVDMASYTTSFFGVPQPSSTLKVEYNPHESGCNGCGTVEPAEEYIRGYVYIIVDQVVVIPY
jgi:hypothetical protein